MPVRVNLVCRLGPNDLATVIADELRKRGLDAKHRTDSAPDIADADVVLLMNNPSSQRLTIRRIEQAGPRRPRIAAWLLEALPPPSIPREVIESAMRYSSIRTGRRWTRPLMELLGLPHDIALARTWGHGLNARQFRFLIDNASFALRGAQRGWLDAIFVSTKQKQLQLADWGIEASFLPVGQQAAFGRYLEGPRDIDVLFLGSLKSPRRRAALDDLAGDLRARGLVVCIPNGGILGEERVQLVNRARTMLHLHQFAWDTPWMRWCLASANGAVMVSEPLSVPDPLRPGIDYLESPLDRISEDIAGLLRDEPRRIAMRDSCKARIGEEMTQAATLDRLAAHLLELATSDLAK